MGQRHQAFIKVVNPVKLKRNYASKEDKAKARKIFGSGKYTMLAIHHQWLYGRSAIYNINHIFNITENMNEYTNPFSDGYAFESLENYIRDIMMLLQVQTNPKHPRGTGIERMVFLNSDCIDEKGKYDNRWDMRLDFTMGDNNDGISIIDSVERKYCLMNICEQEVGSNNVYELSKLEPSSAIQYVNAYYPNIDDIENNSYCNELLKNYPILKLKEIQTMFPKMNLINELVQ
jgi:hypothetical protein